MASIEISYLNGADVDALDLTCDEILDVTESVLAAQGRGETVVEPRMHLIADPAFRGHFNVLRGYIAPMGIAGVKIVSDYVDNYLHGLPSEMALVNLFDARTGTPRAVVDGTRLTDMRTGAVTAIGARHLAGDKPKRLGHIGARGSSFWNVRLLDHLFDFEEIRIHSRRPESRNSFGERMSALLGKPVQVCEDWENCLDGADVIVEASRLVDPAPLLKSSWIKPGAVVIPYGTISAVEDDICDVVDKIVVDDWNQCLIGPFGCLRRHVDAGKVTRDTIHGELGEICAGVRPGRETSEERILLWHRGLSITDIALAQAMLEKAARMGIGNRLPYA